MYGATPQDAQRTAEPPTSIESSRPLVLVVDPDETARSVLEVALTRDGCEVWSASSGQAGLLLLQGRVPDVVVLESDVGTEDGLTFVAQLRGDDRLAQVPVLLLGGARDTALEQLADVVGVDDFLQKPVYARDVTALVRLELARRAQPRSLRFDAQALAPVELLRALLSCARSGRLILREEAEIRFRAGKVIDARIRGKGGDLDTVVRCLALAGPTYELHLEPVDGFAELRCGVRELVELVLPRLQQWTRALQRSLPLGSRLMVDFGRLARSFASLPDGVNRVVQLFDGHRTMEQVLLESALAETLTLEVSTRLYLMGVLQPAKGDETAELLVLRPMPRLFEPHATEAVELMQRLFAGQGELEVAAPPAPAEEDWVTASDTGLEVSDPAGGWTTDRVPEALSSGLSPELVAQLVAFPTAMQVEAPERASAVREARDFAHGDLAAATEPSGLEGAVLAASEHAESVAEIEQAINAAIQPTGAEDDEARFFSEERASDSWARVTSRAERASQTETAHGAPGLAQDDGTLSFAPAVSLEWPQERVSAKTEAATPQTSRPSAGVSAVGMMESLASTSAVAEPQASSSSAVVMPAPAASAVAEPQPSRPAETAPVPQDATSRTQTPAYGVSVSTEAQTAVIDATDSEARFFADDAASEPIEPATPRSTRVWPFFLGAAVIAVLALVIDISLSRAEIAPLPQVPVVAAPAIVAPAPAAEPDPVVAAEPEVEEPLAPPPVDVSENLAEAKRLYESGKYRPALSVLEQVVSDEPTSVTAWNLMGLVRYDAGDSVGAREAAQKVLALEPANARVQILLATLAFDANDKAAGRAALEKYLSLEPDGPHAEEARALLKR